MVVTNYYSVDGEIFGEFSSGDTINYLPDALGSVTAVNGGTQNHTAAYTPHGRGSAPSGATMGWVGARGYRPTGIPEATHYVQARHESTTRGRWTTIDPWWPTEPAYSYCDSSPINIGDPSGEQPKGDSACYQAYLRFGGCTNPLAGYEVSKACHDAGSEVCILAATTPINPEAGKCSGCCSVCYPSCDPAMKLGGVLCTGSRRADILRCAKSSLIHLKPNKLGNKNPEIDPATICPKWGLGDKCQPPGERWQISWQCVTQFGGKQKVITSVCCPCYFKGQVRVVCLNTAPCHSE